MVPPIDFIVWEKRKKMQHTPAALTEQLEIEAKEKKLKTQKNTPPKRKQLEIEKKRPPPPPPKNRMQILAGILVFLPLLLSPS